MAKVVGVDADRLEQMLPPAGVGMKIEPIRLCVACYAESPCHKIEWQFKVTRGCDRHKLSLLSECPNCGAISANSSDRLIKYIFPDPLINQVKALMFATKPD